MKHLARLLLCLSLTLPFVAATAPAPKADDLGEKVAAYCQQHKGEQVGEGECAHLAGHALVAAGAKRRGGADHPNPGDYVWGTQVFLLEAPAAEGQPPKTAGKRADIRRGDIIQFRDVKFGGKRAKGGHYTKTMHHHTAVVASVDGDTIHIFEQNANGVRTVQDGSLKLADLKEGWLRFYRPIPATPK
jgi:hypothetical protein